MLHADCMDYMATLPDKAFELAIVDPPYGIGADKEQNIQALSGRVSNGGRWKEYKKTSWDDSVPTESYFSELFRVSKNQIIWGGNYFSILKMSGCIIWNKIQRGYMTDGELAWSNFQGISIFDMSRADAYINTIDSKIHPTQKPVALYKWLLSRYARPGDRILDTHGGSGSICIACHDLGYDLTWMELDADYYKAAVERYKNHAAQASLFDPVELTKSTTEAPELFTENQ